MSEPMIFGMDDDERKFVEKSAYDALKAKCDAYERALEFYQMHSNFPLGEAVDAYKKQSSTHDFISLFTSRAREVLAKYKGDT